jgi:AcrR family transcriptional regulator
MSRRTRSQTLSLREIVAVALRITRERGLDHVTMRAVAGELGVTPMALYHHLDGKESLTRLVVDEVQARSIPLRLEADGWEESLRRWFWSKWETYRDYPGTGAYMSEWSLRPENQPKLFGDILFFEQAGFEPKEARLAWSCVNTYLHGRVSVDHSLSGNWSGPRVDDLHARDYFQFGIETVIEGLRTRVAGSGGVAGLPGPAAEVARTGA